MQKYIQKANNGLNNECNINYWSNTHITIDDPGLGGLNQDYGHNSPTPSA